MSEEADRLRDLKRRSVLSGIAGTGMLSMFGSSALAEEASLTGELPPLLPEGFTPETPVSSYHPGEPRFVAVGEKLFNPIWAVGFNGEGTPGYEPPTGDILFDKGRDHLGPRLPTLGENFDGYDPDAFEWSLVDAPAESAGESEVLSFTTQSSDVPRYDGQDGQNVVEFEADAEGWYTLALEAPDGTHELTIYAFPATDGAAVYPSNPGGDNGAPRIELDAEYDSDAGEFTISSNAKPAPQETSDESDLWTRFIADDRDGLSTDDIDVHDDGTTATVAAADISGESARIHAAAWDENVGKKSAADVIELGSDGSVDLPSRPPEWIKGSIMYQIFPRSWGGEREETTLETLIDGTHRDGSDDARGIDYLEELGVDVLWITPVVPATSVERQFAYRDEFDIGENIPIDDTEQHLSGGGPHGYDTSDYTGISQDLSPTGDPDEALELYQEFIEECQARGIKVLFDIVINHAGVTNPVFRESIAEETEGPGPWPTVEEWETDSPRFDWWDRADVALVDGDGNLLEAAPRVTGFADLQVMPNLNFDNLALRDYVLSVADFWSREIGVDGFRADIAYGVPHDVWKEIREIVRANDSEFLMFDESIPRVAALSENMFSLHHDTFGFLTRTHEVARNDVHGGELFGTIEQRTADAIPDHSLLINSLENHDEHRILNQAAVDLGDPDHDAVPDEEWEFYANRVRMCWAAAVTLPGVPQLYYGQERQISRYGEGRHLGDEDDRGHNDDGSINVAADVRPGGRQRAFMNWDEYPEEHLEFYKEINEFYHEYEVLHPDAGFEGIFFEVEEGLDYTPELLLFARDGRDLDIDGPELVSVVINFREEPELVRLSAETDTVNLYTGEDIAAPENEDSDLTVVEVDEIAVLETDALEKQFETIAEWDVPKGTDDGPGWYEYPTDEAFNDGAFDITHFEVREGSESVEFAVEVADLENPFGGDNGFSLQFPHLFVHDPESDVDGVDFDPFGFDFFTSFEEEYHLWIEANGFSDPEVYTADQIDLDDPAPLATGSADVDGDEIRIRVPRSVFDASLMDLSLAPLMLGEEGGSLRAVTESGGEWEFEDTEFDDEQWDDPGNPFTRHWIIDTVTPEGVDPDEALAYDTEDEAVIPLVDIEEGARDAVIPGELIHRIDQEAGTDHGPGDYVYPTSDEIPEGSLDIVGFEVYESEDEYSFVFEMAEELTNPWNFEPGFSVQHSQVYLRDPEIDSGTTTAREGVNATFEAPYQYRITGNPEAPAFETADGDTAGNVIVDSFAPENELVLRVSKADVGIDIDDAELAAFMCGHDGFGPGNVRPVTAEETKWTFGGADPEETAPAIIDVVTPPGLDNADVLAYDGDEEATLPLFGLPAPSFVDLIAGRDDHAGRVRIGDDGDTLEVTYTTDDDWTIAETHLAVGTDLDHFADEGWTNPAGNPRPGQFPYGGDYDDATSASYAVDISELDADSGDKLVIAAHVDLDPEQGGSEGGWADGERFRENGNWATYVEYELR